jgi:hypothetical protein
MTQKLKAAARIALLVHDIAETLNQLRARRPVLLRRWLQDGDGLSCYWEVALPGEVSYRACGVYAGVELRSL